MTEARKPKQTLADKLTARQRLILALVGQGMTEIEVGNRLKLGRRTVQMEKRHAFEVCRLHFVECGEVDFSFTEQESEESLRF